jgi:O-antigen ligase
MVNSATYHSHALAIIFSFCAGLLFMYFNWRKKSAWAYLCCLLLLWLSIYFTYTRGALLAILMAVFSGLMILNWRKAVLLVVVFLGVSYSVVKLDPVLMGRVSESINSDKFDTNRVGLFRANMEVFQDHPLFGMGYDIYKNSEVYKQYTQKQKVSEELQDSHAHNQYLQMLSSTGFLGFFFFMCFVLFFLWQNIKVLKIAAKGSELYSVALANLIAHVAILSLFLTDQSFEYTKIRFLVLVVWALTMGLKNQCSALKSQG